ncbi:MAG: hypothetical protein H8D67_12485, partial [Deltaproteobacteria bacterium]|nr:hypothetical protein [Deltaproteobacteria bacterium]
MPEYALDKGYAANEFIDFEVYVEFNPLQTYYEITTLDAFAGGNKENKIPTQTIKAYPINKKIEKPWITTSIINIPIFDYISIDLWLINREKPDDFKLRDLQGGFFTFHI